MNRKTLFLTGLTGTLGREILKKLLVESDARLFLLVRRSRQGSPLERILKILKPVGLEQAATERIKIFEGDVTRDRLGLSDADRAEIIREADEIFHIAALTALNGSRKDCFRINTEGTRRMLELADECRAGGKLDRFFYFSTAYSVGSLEKYHSSEDCLPDNPAHANFYEASKYEAEKSVREAMAAGLPVTIFRPSIVVGDSKTGEVGDFNVIYPFMKLFAHGILKLLPCRPENAFNIVPIDFVVDASLAIARNPDSKGKCFHLVTLNPPTMKMILDLKERDFPNFPPVHMVDPDDFDRSRLGLSEKFVFAMLEPYLGYLNGGLTFDARNTAEFLRGTGVAFPQTDYEFMRTLVRYAIDVGYLVPQN